jgi:hypothetical protein
MAKPTGLPLVEGRLFYWDGGIDGLKAAKEAQFKAKMTGMSPKRSWKTRKGDKH